MSASKRIGLGWSFARLANGIGPIRIAVPAWRPSHAASASAVPLPQVSREELLALFQSDLRPKDDLARRVAAGQSGSNHAA